VLSHSAEDDKESDENQDEEKAVGNLRCQGNYFGDGHFYRRRVGCGEAKWERHAKEFVGYEGYDDPND
jgi:hypothetical protein